MQTDTSGRPVGTGSGRPGCNCGLRDIINGKGYSVTALHLHAFVTDVCAEGTLQASMSQLADRYFVSVATMRRIIRRAEEQNLILVEEQYSPTGASEPCIYRTNPSICQGGNHKASSPAGSGAPKMLRVDNAGGGMQTQEPPAEAPKPPAPPRPPKPHPQPGKPPAWLEQLRRAIHLDGEDADRVVDAAVAHDVDETTFMNIMTGVRTDPRYWYPNALQRSVMAGKLLEADHDLSDEELAQFIRYRLEVAASRRGMPREQLLVLTYKRLEKAGLDCYATGEETDTWRKGRRIKRVN